MVTSYKRVHVPWYCELCGKETFHGFAFGREVSRQVYQDSPQAGMVCDHCKPPAPPKFELSSWFTSSED